MLLFRRFLKITKNYDKETWLENNKPFQRYLPTQLVINKKLDFYNTIDYTNWLKLIQPSTLENLETFTQNEYNITLDETDIELLKKGIEEYNIKSTLLKIIQKHSHTIKISRFDLSKQLVKFLVVPAN